MATTLPFIFRISPLPSNFKSNPQGFANAIVARLSAESEVEIAVFVTGSVEPSSNVGPWLKDGTTWYVWDDVTAAYIPQILEASSLGYIAQQSEPDPAFYTFWIELDGTGKAQSIQYYSAGAWHDVYEDTFTAINAAIAAIPAATSAAIAAALVPYLTSATAASTYAPIASPTLTGVPAAPTATPGSNTAQIANTAFVTAAIAAIPTPGSFQSYPASATNAGTQSITPDGTPVKAVIDTALINPSPSPFNTGSSRYVAPAAGNYGFQISTQLDNNGAAAATMEISADLYKNGVSSGIGDLDGTPSPNGSRWSPVIGGMIALAINDYLEVFIDAADGVGSGSVDLDKVYFSVWRISE